MKKYVYYVVAHAHPIAEMNRIVDCHYSGEWSSDEPITTIQQLESIRVQMAKKATDDTGMEMSAVITFYQLLREE